MTHRLLKGTSLFENGQSVVEMAIGLPILLLLLCGMLDLGRVYFIHVALENGAGEAALYLAINPRCPTAAAGPLQGTAWLGETGNIVLAGHVEMRDGSPGIFAHLSNLVIGDELLLIETGKTPDIYYVSAIQSVQPDDLSVLYPTQTNQLTLITCDDYDVVSNNYRTRTVISAVGIH